MNKLANSSSNSSSPALPANPALAEMHDIMLPEAITTLPIAPAWWLLALCAIALTITLCKAMTKKRKALLTQRQWQANLQKQLSNLATISDDKEYEKSVLIMIQQLLQLLSDGDETKQTQTLTQLTQWLNQDDAELLSITRYKKNTIVKRQRYESIIDTLATQVQQIAIAKDFPNKKADSYV